MTLVSDIIKSAYRETNIIPLAASPTTAQSTEALGLLNNIILSTLGNEANDEVLDLNYGGDFDQSSLLGDWIPDNTRLVLNLSSETELDADPNPYEGQRLSFVDVAGNLDTFNLIIDGNGRNIEGTSTITLDTASDSRQWMYRADTGNWVKIEALGTGDTMPLPQDFDDYFVTALALRLNPRYGQGITVESLEAYKRMKSQIRSRYRRKSFDTQTDPGLVSQKDYNRWGTDAFNSGRLWGWGF